MQSRPHFILVFVALFSSELSGQLSAQTEPNWQLSSQIFSNEVYRGLAVSDFDDDGDNDVISSASLGSLILFENVDAGKFSKTRSSEAPQLQGARGRIAVGDLDGDGDDDLVLAGSHQGFDVWLNEGNSQTAAADRFRYSAFVNSPAITSRHLQLADFDADEDLDLAVGHAGGFSIFANDGAGSFAAAESVLPDGWNQTNVSDLLLLPRDDRPPSLTLVRSQPGQADQQFTAYNTHKNPDYPELFAVEEIFGDGALGIDSTFVSGYFTESGATFYVMRISPGGGSIGTVSSGGSRYPLLERIGSTYYDLGKGDINGDGLDDAFVAGDGISFYLGQPTIDQSSLPRHLTLAAPNLIHRAVLADFNGDDKLDVFALEGFRNADRPLIWMSQPEPESSLWDPLQLPPTPGTFTVRSIATGDIDGDGQVDLIVPDWNNAISFWFADGDSYRLGIDRTFQKINSVQTADLDSDGDQDLLVTSGFESLEVSWWKNQFVESGRSAVSFTKVVPWSASAPSGFGEPRIVDIDGNGTLDVLTLENSRQRIRIHRNEFLNSTLEQPSSPEIATGPALSFESADMDGDGDADVVVTQLDEKVTVWWNVEGEFTTSTTVSPSLRVRSALPVDFDNDGLSDLIVDLKQSPGMQIWWNDGFNVTAPDALTSATLDHSISSRGVGIRRQIRTGDVDGDGFVDIFAGGGGIQGGVLYLNQTSRAFQRQGLEYFAPAETLADLDGDKRADAVFAYITPLGQGALSILRSGGTPVEQTDYHLASSGISLGGVPLPYPRSSIGDVDGDGDDDIVTVAGVVPGTGEGFLNLYLSEGIDQSGSGGFTVENINTDRRVYSRVWLVDLNGDTHLDIVAAADAPKLLVFLGAGDASFAPGSVSDVTAVLNQTEQVPTIHLNDANADGRVDVFASYGGIDANQVFLNLTTSSPGLPSALKFRPVAISPSTYPLVVADVDADGDADLIEFEVQKKHELHHELLGLYSEFYRWMFRFRSNSPQELPDGTTIHFETGQIIGATDWIYLGILGENKMPAAPRFDAFDVDGDRFDDVVFTTLNGDQQIFFNEQQFPFLSDDPVVGEGIRGTQPFNRRVGNQFPIHKRVESGWATELWSRQIDNSRTISETVFNADFSSVGDFDGDGRIDVAARDDVWLMTAGAPIVRVGAVDPRVWNIPQIQFGQALASYELIDDAVLSASLESEVPLEATFEITQDYRQKIEFENLLLTEVADVEDLPDTGTSLIVTAAVGQQFNGYSAELFSSPQELPNSGTSLVAIALKGIFVRAGLVENPAEEYHFRVFDVEGNRMIDEKIQKPREASVVSSLTFNQRQAITHLKGYFNWLDFPDLVMIPRELSAQDKSAIVDSAALALRHPQLHTRVFDKDGEMIADVAEVDFKHLSRFEDVPYLNKPDYLRELVRDRGGITATDRRQAISFSLEHANVHIPSVSVTETQRHIVNPDSAPRFIVYNDLKHTSVTILDKQISLFSPDVPIAAPAILEVYFQSKIECLLADISVLLTGWDDRRQQRDDLDEDQPFYRPLLRNFRDEVLGATAQGRYYTRLYYAHSSEALEVVANRPGAALELIVSLGTWIPAIRAAIDGEVEQFTISSEMHDALTSTIEMFKEHGASEFGEKLEQEATALGVESLRGRTIAEALDRMRTRKLPDDFERIDITEINSSTLELHRRATTRSQKYQVYGSNDLQGFDPIGTAITGDGGPLRWFIEKGEEMQRFFKISPVGFQDE